MSKEKEGKLNETESRAEIRAGLKAKSENYHLMHCSSFAADIKVVTVRMNGVKKITPAQAQTQETKNLPSDQSWRPTCSLTFTMCNALYSLRLTGSSRDASLTI